MAKKLFVLVRDCGDGSCHASYTLNETWIKKQKELYDNGELDDFALGCDGDGFHYDTLTVPDECTLESLGIHFDCGEVG